MLDDGKLCLDVEGGWRNIGHEQPYGVWAPGRWAVELDDAVRLRENYCPRFVYASSIAVFGAPFPPASRGRYGRAPALPRTMA